MIDPLTIAGIANAVVQLGASGVGALIGNNRRKQAEKLMEARKQELQGEMAAPFVDRADSQAILRNLRENQKEQLEGLETDAIKSGATSEAKVAAAAKANEQYANTVSQLAGVGQQHKDRLQQQINSFDTLKVQNLMDHSGIDNILQGLQQAGNSILQVYATPNPDKLK